MTQQVNPLQDRRKHSFHVWLWVNILEAHLSLGAARMFCDRRALSICQQLCSPTLFLHLYFVCLHAIIWLCVAWRVFSGNERLWGGAQWFWISGFSVVSFVYLHISLLQASYLTQICHIPHLANVQPAGAFQTGLPHTQKQEGESRFMPASNCLDQPLPWFPLST